MCAVTRSLNDCQPIGSRSARFLGLAMQFDSCRAIAVRLHSSSGDRGTATQSGNMAPAIHFRTLVIERHDIADPGKGPLTTMQC